MLGRSASRECPDRPYHGFKLAHAVLAASDGRTGFAGLSIGAQRVYGPVADASCVWSGRHLPPRRRCGCGFYCFTTLAEARALSCVTANQSAVLLDVVASGRFIRYERGLRYSHQRVQTVRVGACGCGRAACGLTDAGRGVRGWRYLKPACGECASLGRFVTLSGFSAGLGGQVPVTSGQHVSWVGQRPGDLSRPGEPTPGALPDAGDLASLGAEIALVHARLDHLQAQLSRLHGGPAT